MVFQEKFPVRIAVQHIKDGRDHAYAESFVNGNWMPLVLHWSFQSRRPAVSIGEQAFKVKPYRYLSVKEWINEQAK